MTDGIDARGKIPLGLPGEATKSRPVKPSGPAGFLLIAALNKVELQQEAKVVRWENGQLLGAAVAEGLAVRDCR